MLNFKERAKDAEIRAEQSKYTTSMTPEELRKKTIENNQKNGYKNLTLEEINQYINEVRNERR